MESIFSRLLSLLAYHPDYPSADLDEATQVRDLTDFARYILFYLTAVANEHNLSLIFHVAQRVKQTRDGITKSDEISTRLHTLSDLAQATIRRFADIYSQQRRFGGGTGAASILQTYPGKVGVPSSIFARMNSHEEAQEVAEKNFLPEDAEDLLDRLVRAVMKAKNGSTSSAQVKKRKPEAAEMNGNNGSAKKARKEKEKTSRPRRSSAGTTSKTPKKKKKGEDGWSSDEEGAPAEVTTSARRRSSRGTSKRVSYVDKDSDEDDMEVDEWGQENDEQEDNADDAESENGSDAAEEKVDDDSDSEEQLSEAEELEDPEDSSEPAVAKSEKEKPEAKNKRSEKTATLPTRRSSRRG